MDCEEQLISDIWRLLDDERLVQGLSQVDMSRRLGVKREHFAQRRARQIDMHLSTVARTAHVMGKRVVVMLVDEVPE